MTDHPSIEPILGRIADALSRVPGVEALVLGGSRARGWHNPGSDIDIGLYYRGRFDLEALNRAVTALDDAHRESLACAIGGWGEWVNGGAWSTIDGFAVDIIYRDLDRIDAVIAEAERGQFRLAYHFGHPHGFASAAYAGELAVSQPLRDPNGAIAARKVQLTPYPEALRKEIVRRFLDEAQFTLHMVSKGIAAGDGAYTAGAAFRVTACLAQVLFALNREWLINEKGAVARAALLCVAPAAFAARVAPLFAAPVPDEAALAALVGETAALAASC